MTGEATRTIPGYAVAWRIAVSVVVTVTVALGTLIGNDGWWPFAPMSQYAFSVRNDGVINSLTMAAVTVDGEEVRVPLSKEMIGIERAEIESQAPRIINNPGLLQDVAVLHRRRLAHEPAYRTIWLQNTQRDIRTGATTVRRLVSWEVVDPIDPRPSGISQDAR
ncbi:MULTISPECIES: hypothetical protein [unclassified Knoellia]|uniref:hypothetical protein n=1 Tax=Knoellia altitudinis TaxID=3404795 RepID=UPI00361188A9